MLKVRARDCVRVRFKGLDKDNVRVKDRFSVKDRATTYSVAI